ncbi:MAG: tetratricopeptide repeat protein [Thermoanaerobaculia bacterium]
MTAIRSSAGALTLLALVAAGARDPQRAPESVPTFARDVAPIVYANCAPCHQERGPGPFDLLSYGDVKRRARQIALVTGDRFMPPWQPENPPGTFHGERRLSPEEIATLAAWAEAGAPAGDLSRAPSRPPVRPQWPLGPPDLIVEMEEGYTLPAEGRDVFRNFVLPIPNETLRYVRAVDLAPENPKLIHHATMWIDRTQLSRQVDGETETPGYPSMDPRTSAEDPDGYFLGWTPGTQAFEGSEDVSWRLDPGTDLVLQLHMLPTGRPEPVRVKVGFYWAGRPPAVRPFIVHLGSRTLDIPAGAKDYAIEDEYRLPVAVDALALRPHAHYLGTRVEVAARRPDGVVTPLLEMPWSFNWQEEYHYVDPVSLPAGTVLHLRIEYDNTVDNPLNPHQPPERVRFGPSSFDEMGDLWLQVLPRSEAERAELARDFYHKERSLLIAGYRETLDRLPGDVATRIDLSTALRADGRTEEAETVLREALALAPDDATAHNNLGVLLVDGGRSEEGGRHFERAWELDPTFHEAAFNLGALRLRTGDLGSAERLYREGLKLDPRNARAHNNLGAVLETEGRSEEALAEFEEAARLMPDHVGAHYNAGRILGRSGRYGEARIHFEAALAADPDFAAGHHALGAAEAALGDRDAAILHLRRALELDPSLVAARTLLDRLGG